jgi:hypothetical protein
MSKGQYQKCRSDGSLPLDERVGINRLAHSQFVATARGFESLHRT